MKRQKLHPPCRCDPPPPNTSSHSSVLWQRSNHQPPPADRRVGRPPSGKLRVTRQVARVEATTAADVDNVSRSWHQRLPQPVAVVVLRTDSLNWVPMLPCGPPAEAFDAALICDGDGLEGGGGGALCGVAAWDESHITIIQSDQEPPLGLGRIFTTMKQKKNDSRWRYSPLRPYRPGHCSSERT